MEYLRSPDERFANLPGYNFAPHYVQVDEMRMHYIDEGPNQVAARLEDAKRPRFGAARSYDSRGDTRAAR